MSELPEVIDYLGTQWVRMDVVQEREQRLAEAEALLTTACDAWECGQMVWRPDGVLMSDYKAAMLPRAWYEAAKGGRE